MQPDDRTAVLKGLFRAMFFDIRQGAPDALDRARLENAFIGSPHLQRFRELADRYGVFRIWTKDDGPLPMLEAPAAALGDILARYYDLYARTLNEAGGSREAAFESFWDDRSDEILNYKIRILRSVYLANVNPAERYELAPNVSLRVAVDADREAIGQFLRPIHAVQGVLELNYVQRIDYRGPDSHLPSLDLHKSFRSAIVLFAEKAAAETLIIDQQLGVHRNNGIIELGSHPFGGPVIVNDRSIEQVRAIIARCNAERAGNDDRSRRVQRALDFLALGYALPPNDVTGRFVDGWLSLEALFGSKSETTFKLAYRIAGFTEPSPPLRRQFFDEMSASYKMRSDYLHGQQIDTGEMSRRDVLHIARRALLRIVEDPASYPGRVSDIEMGLLTG